MTALDKREKDALDGFVDAVFAYKPQSEIEFHGKIRGSILDSELGLAALALALGAESVGRLSSSERELTRSLPIVKNADLSAVRKKIENGYDPLGEAFCTMRDPTRRREQGAVYTPKEIVRAMIGWAATVGTPERVIDPGAGSGRFIVESGRVFPNATLIAVETDPLAALMARANLAVAGMADRADVFVEDFRSTRVRKIDGKTLYVGNPPYVRHHQISSTWKGWLKEQAAEMSLTASSLAGLHVYFFLAISRWAKAGDYGALITAAEWLDVNYGKLVRELFLDRLGGQSVYVIDPKAEPFPGTQTTAAVTSFTVNGKPPSARFARIDTLTDLDHLLGGRRISRKRLVAESRWSHFTRGKREIPQGYVELGELCRVHRGQVTGANRVWIAGKHSRDVPAGYLFPTVTKARELFGAGSTLSDVNALRRVIDLPADLSELSDDERKLVERFLEIAEKMGGKSGYIAQHRKAWWSVGLREPAPILATYMARRPPAFVLNKAGARHLNIAHGLYPRDNMADSLLRALAGYLRDSTTLEQGRVYAGGLTKFEPREMERIPVPDMPELTQMANA